MSAGWAVMLCLLPGAAALQEQAAAALAPVVEGAEAAACPNKCSGNGECFSGTCKCFPGYTYYDCSLRACRASAPARTHERTRTAHTPRRLAAPHLAGVCPSDCSNNGFCYNATCHCNPGWKGGDCSIQTCPDECNYHGSCKSGKCVCRPGWKGDACEIRTCPNECSGHGSCVNFKCQCSYGFTGFDCASIACPADCSGKGTCYNGASSCCPRARAAPTP